MTSPSEANVLIPRDLSSARLGAFRKDREILRFGGLTMGTSWSAQIAVPIGVTGEPVETAIQQVLNTVVRQMSPWETDSDLQRFRRASPGEQVPFRKETFSVLLRALEIAEQTHGIYDPTFANAIDLLGFGPSLTPGCDYDSPQVRSAFQTAGFEKLEVDRENESITQPGGLGLDLCAIAKGYTVDRIGEIIESYGFSNYVIEIGGEAKGLGCKPSGDPWLFRIESSETSAKWTNPDTFVALCGLALASSGNSRRFRQSDSATIGHLVHPSQDGKPSDLESVSVISHACMDADAYATALFLMGKEDGLAFAEQNGIAAVVQTDCETLFSSRAAELLD